MSFDDFLAKFSVKEASVKDLLPPLAPPKLPTTDESSVSERTEETSRRPEWRREPTEAPSEADGGAAKSILDLNPWLFPSSSTTTRKPWSTMATAKPAQDFASDKRERMLSDLMNDRSNRNLWTTRLGTKKNEEEGGGDFDFGLLGSGAGKGDYTSSSYSSNACSDIT
jgi:hypothetical protein